jgi:hypothetical protein
VETGYRHSALIFKHEASVSQQSTVVRGALLQFLEKAMYAIHVQLHAEMEDKGLVFKKCYAPLSLVTPHVCGEALPSLTRLNTQKSTDLGQETELKGHTGDVTLLQWTGQDLSLITRSEDSIKVWSIKDNSCPLPLPSAPNKTIKLFQPCVLLI